MTFGSWAGRFYSSSPYESKSCKEISRSIAPKRTAENLVKTLSIYLYSYLLIYVLCILYVYIKREKERKRRKIHMLDNLAYRYLAGRAGGNWRLVLCGIKTKSGAIQKARNKEKQKLNWKKFPDWRSYHLYTYIYVCDI